MSGGQSRLADLHISVAAGPTAQALNIGYRPIISPVVRALTRGRISHVDQTYLRAENVAAANAPLIEAQASIGLAQASKRGRRRVGMGSRRLFSNKRLKFWFQECTKIGYFRNEGYAHVLNVSGRARHSWNDFVPTI